MKCKKFIGTVQMLTRLGDDEIKFQNIAGSLTNISTNKKKEVKVTFVTGEEFITPGEVMSGNFRNIGFLLWLPREKVERIIAEIDRENANAEKT